MEDDASGLCVCGCRAAAYTTHADICCSLSRGGRLAVSAISHPHATVHAKTKAASINDRSYFVNMGPLI